MRVENYQTYKNILYTSAKSSVVQTHAYAYITNNVHVLATVGSTQGIRLMLEKLVDIVLCILITNMAERERFWKVGLKSLLKFSGFYVLACMRCIEMNPVKTGFKVNKMEYRLCGMSICY